MLVSLQRGGVASVHSSVTDRYHAKLGCMYVCLCVCLCISLPFCLCACLQACLCLLYVRLHVCPRVCLSVCLCVCHASICVSVYTSVILLVCLAIFLCVCLHVWTVILHEYYFQWLTNSATSYRTTSTYPIPQVHTYTQSPMNICIGADLPLLIHTHFHLFIRCQVVHHLVKGDM